MYGSEDPYKKLRDEVNSKVLSIANRLQDLIANKGLEVVACANAIDIPCSWFTFDVNDYLRKLVYGCSTIVDDRAYQAIEVSKSIAIVVDNTGEIVVDILFARELASRRKDVYVVCRSLPYEVDAICNEVKGLAEAVGAKDINIVETGSRYPVFAYDRVSRLAIDVIESVDLVISKGIANYEAAMEYHIVEHRPILFALCAKCVPIARALGVVKGMAVAKVFNYG